MSKFTNGGGSGKDEVKGIKQKRNIIGPRRENSVEFALVQHTKIQTKN